jgi:hypothetical protein
MANYSLAPDWTPLEEMAGRDACHNFMYMGIDGDIRLYKHRDTRRYLNIDNLGRTWKYTTTGYVLIPKAQALANAGLEKTQ